MFSRQILGEIAVVVSCNQFFLDHGAEPVGQDLVGHVRQKTSDFLEPFVPQDDGRQDLHLSFGRKNVDGIPDWDNVLCEFFQTVVQNSVMQLISVLVHIRYFCADLTMVSW